MITIVTPVYNSTLYLQRYVDSVLQQTYTDFELLLIDDASTDDSYTLCLQYEEQDDRIKVLHHDINMGAACSRNDGLKAARGEYITFADSDDLLPQDAIGKLYQNALKEDSDIVFGNLKVVDQNGCVRINRFPGNKRRFNNREAISAYLNFYVLYGASCGKLYKMECARKAEFPVNMKIGEDGVFCARVIANADRVSAIDDVVYIYQQRNDSVSQRGIFSCKELEDRILQKQYVEQAFSKLMNPKDFMVFEFELYRVVRYWEKNYYNELIKSEKEYCELKMFCDRKWLPVMLYTYNLRIKIRAIKYMLHMV